MLSAIKIHWQSGKEKDEYELLSEMLGLDIMEDAQRTLDRPDKTRHIVEIFKPKPQALSPSRVG